VHYPGGRRLDHQLKVSLRGVNLPEKLATTDDNGAFTFTGLRGGSYTVAVEAGKGYEPASEAVNLPETDGTHGSGGRGQTLHVRIELQTKQETPQAVATVTVISEEALALYKQAVSAAGGGDRKPSSLGSTAASPCCR
jgi:hypothetical protein